MYLGTIVDDRALLGPEIAHRESSSGIAFQELTKALREVPQDELDAKLLFWDSLTVNSSMFAAGAWFRMHTQDLIRFRSQYVRKYRRILKLPRFESGGPTDSQVLSKARRPAPDAMIIAARLRLFGQVVQAAPFPLLCLLQSEYVVARSTSSNDSWLHHIQEDLSWLRVHHHAVAHMPLPSADPSCWLQLVRRSASSWKSLIRGALDASVQKNIRDHQGGCWEKRVLDLLTAHGLPPPRDLPQQQQRPPGYQCPMCSTPPFGTIASLSAHIRGSHLTHSGLARRYAANEWCSACMRVFSSRHLLIRHLASWSPRCFAYHLLCLPRMPVELQAVRDDLETEQNKSVFVVGLRLLMLPFRHIGFQDHYRRRQ